MKKTGLNAVIILAASVLVLFSSMAFAAPTSRTVLSVSEKKGSIYAVYDDGKSVKISKKGKFKSPKLAADKRTIGYLNSSRMGPKDGLAISYTIDASSILYIYKDGKVLIEVSPDSRPFIWEWKFHNDGKQVVLKTGHTHGLSNYELYDIEKNKLIEEFAEKENAKMPDWAQGLE